MKTHLSPPPAVEAHRRWPLPLRIAIAVLGVVVVALAVLLVRGPQAPPSLSAVTSPPATASPSAAGPEADNAAAAATFSTQSAEAAYAAIQEQRDEAYRRVDPAMLRAIYAPSCPCLAQDLRDLDRQRREGYHFDGPSAQVRNVRAVLDRSARTAVVVAEVNYGASRYVDANDNVRFVEKNRGWQTARTILTWDGRRWRVAQIVNLA